MSNPALTESAAGSAAGSAGGRGRRSRRGPRWLPDEAGVLVVLAVLVIGVGVFRPDFLRSDNLIEVARQSSYVGILACGMVFPLAMREVDLSVGGTYALCIVTGAVLMRDGMSPWLAAPLAVGLGGVLAIIRRLAAEGRVVLICSTDLAELAAVCDRVIVLRRGRVTGEHLAPDLSEHTLLHAINAATPS
jgi:hypothetical protein